MPCTLYPAELIAARVDCPTQPELGKERIYRRRSWWRPGDPYSFVPGLKKNRVNELDVGEVPTAVCIAG